MSEILNIIFAVSPFLFTAALAFYAITCFQWFSYKPTRVLFHFTRPLWHTVFFALPLVLFYTTDAWFWIYFYFALLPSLFLWHKKLDKKLVFTARVKRYFFIVALALVLQAVFSLKFQGALRIEPLFIIVVSLFISEILERMNAANFRRKAEAKLRSMPNLKIVLITASYGKTSIKNFLFELLNDDFVCHKTPRSVNTLVGLIKDVNENLNEQTQIYIAEAGARLKGDIAEISAFLEPQIVIVGEIGEQHIEYFKTLENIRATKLEALQSRRLKRAFLHSSAQKTGENIEVYDDGLKQIEANLDGIKFELDGAKFSSPLLGAFNATNLAVCIRAARFLGIKDELILRRLQRLKNVEHRLQRMDAGGKVIIDDGFNGNFAGMSSSYALVAGYKGRKVLVTPGIVESTAQENERLARTANEIFDLVIITSPLNAQALLKGLNKPQVIILKDKTKMQETLAKQTRAGDLILFSNDAPSFM